MLTDTLTADTDEVVDEWLDLASPAEIAHEEQVVWALAEALATGPVQVVISDCGPDAEALWQVATSTYLGGGYLVRGAADAPGVPLLSGRPGVSGASAAYRCRGTVCDLPVTSPAAITVHARTRKELSDVPAQWEYVKRAVEIARGSGVVMLGNGDVKTSTMRGRKRRQAAWTGS